MKELSSFPIFWTKFNKWGEKGCNNNALVRILKKKISGLENNHNK